MNPLFRKIIYRALQQFKAQETLSKTFPASTYSNAKAIRQQRARFKREIRNMFLIGAGILTAGFGLESFLLPNKFIDGGVTGISLLVAGLTDISLSVLIVLFNIPFIVLGLTQVNRNFAFKTACAIVGLALCISFIHYPILTDDKLLVSVFGGFFLGAGIGLAMRGEIGRAHV